MSELRDRLERLAGRGTPRGVDEVMRAAQRSAPREIGVTAPTGDDRDLDIIDDLPYVSGEPARRRGRYSTLIAATGVAVLAGVGVLAVTAMFGSGGADSPEAAVRQLADAVAHRDPLAAVDVLAPSEVRTMHEDVQHLTQRAADLKIIDRASDPLAGVDLSVDNLELSSTDLADGYAKVTITRGTVSAGVRRAALSELLRDATREDDEVDPSGKVDLARLGADADLPTFVITVRRDGRWYVSPIYTALEYAREANDGPPADFGSADASKLGADTPQHAVEDALHAWQASDWNRMLALAPPSELPLYDYRAWINQEAADTRVEFTIDRLTTTADTSGDHGVVKLEASGTMGSGGDRQTWQVGGTCPSLGDYFGFSFSDDTESQSTNRSGLCLAGNAGAAIPFGRLAVDNPPDGSASGPVSIRVVREGGRWYVSPVGTVLDMLDSFVQQVDERTLYPIIGLGWRLPPDATLTLNQPYRVADATRYGQVFQFDGTADQEVIGQTEGGPNRYNYGSAELYTADGEHVAYINFGSKEAGGCCAYRETLPKTGSYRLVMLEPLPAGMTLTLFDTDHTPKELLHNDGYASTGEECTFSGNTQVCSSFGEASGPLDEGSGLSGVTPTTALPNPREVTDTTAVGKSREATATTAP